MDSDIEYLREKYGPFASCGKHSFKEGWKCSFCGTRLVVALQIEAQRKPGVYLHVCYSCAEEALGKTDTYKAWFSHIGITPISLVTLEFEESREDAKKRLVELDPDAELKLVIACENYRKAGFGMKWKTVSGICDFYRRKRYLTEKQTNVLKGYKKLCEREVEEYERKKK